MGKTAPFTHHLFICTNQRAAMAERLSCGEETGMALVKAFKQAIKSNNLQVAMRAQKAGCLDICEHGPNVVVYPEAVFYGNVQLQDVEEIVKEHLMGGRIVERLRLYFPVK